MDSCQFGNLRIIRIKKNVQLRMVEILFIFNGGRFLHFVRVVQHDAEIADSAHTRFGADGRHPRLQARKAECAFFRHAVRRGQSGGSGLR